MFSAASNVRITEKSTSKTDFIIITHKHTKLSLHFCFEEVLNERETGKEREEEKKRKKKRERGEREREKETLRNHFYIA